MKLKNSYLILSFFYSTLASCVLGGTHGSLKEYCYPVPKSTLQNAVENALKSNDNVYSNDTSQQNYVVIFVDGKPDTISSANSYNDHSRYVSMKIKEGNNFYDYTFQYVGTIDDWEKDNSSCISISYVYDDKGNGGSVGNGGLSWYKFRLRRRFTVIFEREVIKGVNSQLKLGSK